MKEEVWEVFFTPHPAELIEDFEHPICQICMGIGMVRDENGIHMVTCDYCEGEGRAPAPE